MPAATTHVEFAKDVYALLPASAQEKINNLPLYYLGSQGPDVFFFSKGAFIPGTIKAIGSKMHNDYVKETILFIANYIKDHPSLYSYYQGYLCHYILDKEAHPLINYFSEIAEMRTGEAHIHYEADIDTYMLKLKGHEYDVFESLKITQQDASELADIYHYLFLEVFQKDIKKERIYGACYYMSFFTKLLRPGNTVKYNFVHSVESLVHRRFLSAMMLDKKDGEESIILNLNHEPWPEGGSDTRSFIEVYEDASKIAAIELQELHPEEITLTFNGHPIEENGISSH